MREDLLELASRIQREIAELERVRDLALRRWQKTLKDEDYLGSVAFDLQSFYQGIERTFEYVAGLIDGSVPRGEQWHKLLIRRMAEDMPGIRPAVITAETRDRLDVFRKFRHLARNIYVFNLDPTGIRNLIEKLPEACNRICADLSDFAEFLSRISTIELDK